MKYHWHVPFDLSTGEAKQVTSGETFNMIIMDYLDKKMQTSTAPIAAVNAAIPGAFGLKTFQENIQIIILTWGSLNSTLSLSLLLWLLRSTSSRLPIKYFLATGI